MFQSEDGRIFTPTARRIWEQLLIETIQVTNYLPGDEGLAICRQAWKTIEQAGRAAYDELVLDYRNQLRREEEKREYAFASRRKAINRLGLPTVRQHRLAHLAQEESAWRQSSAARSGFTPDLDLLLLLQVKGLGT